MLTRRAVMGGLASMPVAACSGASGDGGRPLRLWAISYEGDYAPLLMPAFTRRTGLRVEVQTLPWTAAHEKLLTAFAGNVLPDVMMLPNAWVGEFAMIGATMPLTGAAQPRGSVPGVQRAMRFAGQDRAAPWSVSPQMQYFRRDLFADIGFDTPPIDWDSWRQAGMRLKRRRPDAYAFLILLNWWDTLFTFAGQTGTPLLREADTLGNFRSPAFAETLRFYASLFADGLAPTVLSTEVQDPVASFAQGWFASYPSPPTLVKDLRRRADEIPAERWGVTRMPGPQGPASVSSVSGALAVSSQTTRPAEALALLRYLTSPDAELELYRLIGNLPACAAAWQMPALTGPAMRPYAAQVATPSNEPLIVEWERIRLEVQLVAEQLVRGSLGFADALTEMDRRTDRILAKRRSLVDAGKLA